MLPKRHQVKLYSKPPGVLNMSSNVARYKNFPDSPIAWQSIPSRPPGGVPLPPGATLPVTLPVRGLSPGGDPPTARRHTSDTHNQYFNNTITPPLYGNTIFISHNSNTTVVHRAHSSTLFPPENINPLSRPNHYWQFGIAWRHIEFAIVSLYCTTRALLGLTFSSRTSPLKASVLLSAPFYKSIARAAVLRGPVSKPRVTPFRWDFRVMLQWSERNSMALVSGCLWWCPICMVCSGVSRGIHHKCEHPLNPTRLYVSG
ncbi:hypothetical protein DEO72_LG2g3275 [Vigna unguiculata]|uniref:Uncharacterized protein n=1 Tax=Vigna unguiculata TaxID=3917 RepID=A0A4D6L354_VIGUN|nr:hypothetical protein DEO72_LG2g3275 [Vigna unguiculata]